MTTEIIRDLHYFWREKEDIERCSSFDYAELTRMYPDLAKAWGNYKHAKYVFDLAMKDHYKVVESFEDVNQ